MGEEKTKRALRRSKYSILLQFLNYCNFVTNVVLYWRYSSRWPHRSVVLFLIPLSSPSIRDHPHSSLGWVCPSASGDRPINRDSKINMTSGWRSALLCLPGLFKGDSRRCCSSHSHHITAHPSICLTIKCPRQKAQYGINIIYTNRECDKKLFRDKRASPKNVSLSLYYYQLSMICCCVPHKQKMPIIYSFHFHPLRI